MDRLILDTTILIAAGAAIDEVVSDEDDAAIAAVTAAELLVGVELADPPRKAARGAYVEALLATIPIEPYDLEVARAHANLLAHTRATGRRRGAHDLLIAATAQTHSRTIVTADGRGFDDLPGIAVRLIPGGRAAGPHRN